MGKVISENPSGGVFKSNSPTSGLIQKDTEGYVYLENKQIRVGEPMGLLLTITYPNTFTFIGERI